MRKRTSRAHIIKQPLAPEVSAAVKIDGVHLLFRMADDQIMLIGKFFPGEDHWNADRRHEADKGELDPLLCLYNAIIM